MNHRVAELLGWLDEVNNPDWLWHAKYIAANDTYAKANVHQGGPYLAKELLRQSFPKFSHRAETKANPDLEIPVSIDSHGVQRLIRLVWYNSRRLTGQANGRDEARLTGWGGRASPLLAPEATGSLAVFAFKTKPQTDAEECRVWLCDSAEEEDLLLSAIGDVEPGRGVLFSPSGRFYASLEPPGTCRLTPDLMPPTWLETFPSGAEIVRWVIEERTAFTNLPVDERLLKRRDCEFDVFLSVEKEHVLPRATEGFKTVDEFVDFANAVTNRRKSRSGRSLELHLRRIFDEEQVSYSPQPRTEGSRTPDFLFPSHEAYHDPGWPVERLRMLAAKTTCKDRWRQILNEAVRVQPVKHLFTLQEGVSVEQHREMTEEGVALVVPKQNLSSFPDEVRPKLLTLEDFVTQASSIA